METRTVAVLQHPERAEAISAAAEFIRKVHDAGLDVLVFPEELGRMRGLVPDASIEPLGDRAAELVVVFGGDGTILRAAEWAHPLGVPLLGVNLGHVGFLAELETSDIHVLHEAVINRDYEVEERLVLDVSLETSEGERVWETIAVNEVSLEKRSREKMLNVMVSIDERPLSRWGCDGVLVSTPTGSTAYGFSAGGPVVWPDVRALLVIPISAHALFNRPMVISPSSKVRMDLPTVETPGVLWCDGRRSADVSGGDVVRVVAHETPLHLARLAEQPFTTRLVKKFALPVNGWRRLHEPGA